MNTPHRRVDGFGVTALIIGATGIGLAPILVRLSETGPVATAFYRLLLAQPIIWLLLRGEKSPATEKQIDRKDLRYAALAGLLFTADLSIWHWSLKLTTVANSTFVTNLTPFFVTIAAWMLYREKVTRRLMLGMLIGFAGGFLMVAESMKLDPRFLIGDILALIASIFYSGYLLVVKQLRRGRSTWYVMAWTGVFAAPTMFLVAAITNETLLPSTPTGWFVLAALALISQLGGQGLIAYGLAHLSASISAVLLMWQPVVAALLAWWILHEPLTPLRALGGAIIIVGILIGTWRTNSDRATN
jgi:drug/metabolite transporter (DMT)-like permease